MSSPQHYFKKGAQMLAKVKNGHANIQALFNSNFLATYNIRSPKQDSEKKIVLCKKGDGISQGQHRLSQYFADPEKSLLIRNTEFLRTVGHYDNPAIYLHQSQNEPVSYQTCTLLYRTISIHNVVYSLRGQADLVS